MPARMPAWPALFPVRDSDEAALASNVQCLTKSRTPSAAEQ